MSQGIWSLRGLLQTIVAVLPPVLLLAAGFAVVENPAWLPPAVILALGPIGFGLAAVGVLLGWWFGSTRAIFASLLLAFGLWLLDVPLSGGADSTTMGRIVYPAYAALLPFNVLWLALVEEKAPFGLGALGHLLILLAQVFIVAFIATNGSLFGLLDGRLPLDPEGLRGLRATTDAVLHGRLLDAAVDRWTNLPQPALLLFAAAGVVLFLRLMVTASPIDAGSIGALAAAAVALHRVGDRVSVDIFMVLSLAMMIVALLQRSYRLAFIDDVTGLPGRRALNQELKRLRGRYAVAMIDIDHFKKFNDTYGHDVGDQVLRMVGWRLKGASGGGRAFRYGGEEFTLLFPAKTVEDALPHVEGLRLTIANSGFRLRAQNRPRKKPRGRRKAVATPDRGLTVTVSIGLAHKSDRLPKAADVMAAADKALYRAKNGGRNRVVI